jgi:hypothetical protein
MVLDKGLTGLYVLPMARNETNQNEAMLYDFAGAAAWLNVRESWLRRAVTAQTVPHRRVGRAVRFTAEDLHQIVADSAVSVVNQKTEIRPSRRRRTA